LRSEITEFSYGFALTREFVDNSSLGLMSAPQFPSLTQEGQIGGGYDVAINLGTFLYLQFKLSEYMVGSQAGEGDVLALPYHRFWLMPSSLSLQHEMLLDLEAAGSTVFYAAPRFHLQSEFNTRFANEEVLDQSIFVAPQNIGVLPTTGDHCVAFDDTSAYRCSKPLQVKTLRGMQVYNQLKTQDARSPETEANRLESVIRSRDLAIPHLPRRNRRNVWREISYLAHSYLHCEVFFRDVR